MLLFDMAMRPVIWGVSTGLKAVYGAGRAAGNAVARNVTARGVAGTAESLVTNISRAGGEMLETAVSHLRVPGRAVSSVIFRSDKTSPFGVRTRRFVDDFALLGLAGIGAYAGFSRGASIGTVTPGEHLSYTGTPMTPERLRQNVRVSAIDNLGADGGLALALHQLR